MPLVEISGLVRRYGKGHTAVEALRGLDLVVEQGELLAVLGRSGSGKSTLLNLLSGLDSPTEGSVRVGDRDLARLSADGLADYRSSSIGIVFQSFHLLPGRTALANVAMPLVLDGVPAKERRRKALATLESVGLGDRVDHRPSELSGGEQQRVAIARALVRDPEMLVCDEPTGNLDSSTADGVVELLLQLNRERGVTILLVTHDRLLARRCASRIVEMADGVIVDEEIVER